jgi:hypothetical protein
MKKHQLLMLAFLFASCGPLNKQYNKNTFHNDLKEIKETGIPEEDTILLNYYIKNALVNGKKIDSNATYKQLLEKAKTEKTKREINAFMKEDSIKNASLKEKTKADELKKIISVAFVSVAATTSDQGGEFTILLNIQNNGAKNIKAFKGIMIFYDLFGAVIKKYELKYNLIVNAKEAKTYYYRTKFNDKIESDVALSEMDEENIHFVFEPVQILFLDGTEMNL